MTLTASQIERIARYNGLKSETVIPSRFEEVELLMVTLKFGVVALFKMNNETFEYTYSHTYNALTDKTTKRTPKLFKCKS